MTDAEYKTLTDRVANGKKFLEGKWGSKDPQVRDWVTVWMSLADRLFEEQCKRGYYTKVPNAEEMKASQEATLERVRQQMIAAGVLKPKKGGK